MSGDLYEIGKLIGIGSFGQVHQCKHKHQGKFYVVKKLRMMELEQKDRQNIENQLKLLQKLRHPNIVSYKDSYTDKDGNLCIVMTFCEGGDMYAKIRSTKEKSKNFSEPQILDWIAQTALAIHYLHNQKILHRDLKSQNLFLRKDEKVRLGDFGIAKVLDNAQDLTSTCIGTPYYMAPQIFKYKAYSYKCDVWSFGVIIYEMCNLRLPFQAQSYNALAIKIIKGLHPSITPTYSKQLRDLITSMLSLKPQNRPTIVEVINKPFIRKRVQKYMNDLFTRNSQTIDNEDIFLDSLREQALSLNINLTEEEGIRRYPSSKDLDKRWSKNILSKKGGDEEQDRVFREKRRSLLQKESLSLEKNIRKRQETTTSSSKAFQLRDEKDAFIDHKKKSMMGLERKLVQKNKNIYENPLKTRQNIEQKQKQKEKQIYSQKQNLKRFRLQQDYSMSDQAEEDDDLSINEIIRQESDEDITELSATNMILEEDEEAPENYNKTYYKLLDQLKVLRHICETGIGTNKFLKAYNAVSNGYSKEGMMEILGQKFIGYWHLLDQIMFSENILKTLSKE